MYNDKLSSEVKVVFNRYFPIIWFESTASLSLVKVRLSFSNLDVNHVMLQFLLSTKVHNFTSKFVTHLYIFWPYIVLI